MWYASSANSHGRSSRSSRIEVPSGGKTWPRLSNLGPEVRGQLTVESTDQPARTRGSTRFFVRRYLLKGGDRRAGPVMLEDQLEPAFDTDAVIEGDLDDRAQSLVVF